MTFQGAVIKEQGIVFAVVIVKEHVVDNKTDADSTIEAFRPAFPGMPVVLMAQDNSGVPRYYGRPDLAQFMADVPLESVPWREYTL